jgi:7,8-dihydropterin-6-yl-methyl-4-(beta-D-ribofuranosyl)aminobenzene 5'-phosphate synthase
MSFSIRLMIIFSAVIFSAIFLGAHVSSRGDSPSGPLLRFTVLYDNYLYQEGTKPDWGFSCLIEGTEKTILFDTGTQPQILMHNAGVLSVDLKKINQIVISHIHGDHTGGLSAVLEQNPNVTVFFPVSFPPEFGRRVEILKARVQAVDKLIQICPKVFLTGEMGDEIKEQSLIVDTARGLIIVTGCSHQGIVNILRRAREILDKPIYLVFGGFHLMQKSNAQIEEIIAAFKELKVEKCGATHCTGDNAIAMFKKAFSENYVPMGTGKVITLQNW